MTQGKVASILSEYQLVLNVGASQGVKRGDTFVIFEEGDEVINPDNGESLGRIELVKAQVIVAHVQDALCLVESPRRAIPNAENDVLSARLARVTTAPEDRLEREHEKLDVLRAEINRGPALRPIRIGDLARAIE